MLYISNFSKVQLADLEKVFDDADTDGSGKLCFKELMPKLQEKGYKECDIRQLIDQADTNEDDQISKCEWMAIAKDIVNQRK